MSFLNLVKPHRLLSGIGSFRQLHVSSSCCTARWRRERKLVANKTSAGPLTDLPDYTFLDGRPTPIGGHQRKRLMNQRVLTQKIITLSGEIDFAVDRHKKLIADEEARRDTILSNKLKSKGEKAVK